MKHINHSLDYYLFLAVGNRATWGKLEPMTKIQENKI